jgi:hypothetical protein
MISQIDLDITTQNHRQLIYVCLEECEAKYYPSYQQIHYRSEDEEITAEVLKLIRRENQKRL